LINNEFFKVTQALLFQNSYFVDPKEEECLDLESADQLKQLEFIKNWMRSESFGEFKKTYGNEYPNLNGMFEDVITYDDTVYEHACCGTCQIWAENFDVYYWLKPGANTSCLDIVGDKIDPIDYGGTTDAF